MSWDFVAHYKVRLGVIDREADSLAKDSGPKLVLLGDSLTESHPAREICGVRVVNQGISGDEADHSECGVLRRADRAGRVQPCCVFLLVGVNDLHNRKPVDTYIEQYAEVLKALRESVTGLIFVQSVLPTRDFYVRLLPNIKQANVRLQQLAFETGCRWLDLFSLMTDDKGEMRESFTTDGIHLTPPAYEVWTRALESTVAEMPTIA